MTPACSTYRAVSAHIDRRLWTEPIIWPGRHGPDRRPHFVPVWFLQKVRNLRRNPTVVLALNAADRGSDTVMLEGRAAFVDDPTVPVTMPEFARKVCRHTEAVAGRGVGCEVLCRYSHHADASCRVDYRPGLPG